LIKKILAGEVQLRMDDYPPRYNIAPSQPVIAVREVPKTKERELLSLRWGLIPSWAKDAKIGNKLINCRAETVFEKPSFRAAVKSRRCLIPADGYYEWKTEGKTKKPYYITLKSQEPFCMAGLWERWHFEDIDIESCTIMTTQANEYIQTIHHRMPVIIKQEKLDIWLDQTLSGQNTITELFSPYPPDEIELHAVSTLVNKAANDGPECISPAIEEAALF
jgi:putative SOS response-associated peptidase YedK